MIGRRENTGSYFRDELPDRRENRHSHCHKQLLTDDRIDGMQSQHVLIHLGMLSSFDVQYTGALCVGM